MNDYSRMEAESYEDKQCRVLGTINPVKFAEFVNARDLESNPVFHR